jgi:alkylation response protein AidB-like acyl-CoA dehydrogenase
MGSGGAVPCGGFREALRSRLYGTVRAGGVWRDGTDFLSYVLLIEEISRVDADVVVTLAVHTSAGTLPILVYGNEEQKASFVPDLARGRRSGVSP